MTDWHNIRTWKRGRFAVTLDHSDEEWPDLSWDETGEVADKIARGIWGNFLFRVQVTLDGREIGVDYLGNSIYADPEDFYLEHIGIAAKARADGKNYGCYFTDLIGEAISDARRTICNAPRLRCA